jgi:hypothetical protein
MKAWMHRISICLLATPVTVMARGPKRAHVKLRHAIREGRKNYPPGSTRYVPSWCLGDKPRKDALVSIGRGHYVRQDSAGGRRVVASV